MADHDPIRRGDALKIVGPMASSNSLYAANAGQAAYDAIRALPALPLPPRTPLDAEVAGVVERLSDHDYTMIVADAEVSLRDLIERLNRERGEYEAALWEADGKLSDAVARAERAEAEVARLRETQPAPTLADAAMLLLAACEARSPSQPTMFHAVDEHGIGFLAFSAALRRIAEGQS